jgi:hypothetical protein
MTTKATQTKPAEATPTTTAKPVGVLPTASTPPKRRIEDLSILLYGAPKIGKSSFAAQFPDALFLPTEPGLNSLDVFQAPADGTGVKDWPELSRIYSEVARGGHGFKTTVIDTIGNAYEFAAAHVCGARNVEYAGDLAHGKGWGLIKAEFKRLITAAAKLPFGLIMIAHATNDKIEQGGSEIIKTRPTLSNACREVLLGLCDMILFFDVEKVNDDNGNVRFDRVLRTKPNANFEAGDRSGTLPAVIRVPNGASMSGPEHSRALFNEFRKAYESGVKK